MLSLGIEVRDIWDGKGWMSFFAYLEGLVVPFTLSYGVWSRDPQAVSNPCVWICSHSKASCLAAHLQKWYNHVVKAEQQYEPRKYCFQSMFDSSAACFLVCWISEHEEPVWISLHAWCKIHSWPSFVTAMTSIGSPIPYFSSVLVNKDRRKGMDYIAYSTVFFYN